MITEDELEINLVGRALANLTRADEAWQSNFNTYCSMNDARKLKWWRHIKAHAQDEKPLMQPLLLEILKLRMTT